MKVLLVGRLMLLLGISIVMWYDTIWLIFQNAQGTKRIREAFIGGVAYNHSYINTFCEEFTEKKNKNGHVTVKRKKVSVLLTEWSIQKKKHDFDNMHMTQWRWKNHFKIFALPETTD